MNSSYQTFVEVAAAWATIATLIVGGLGYGKYLLERRARRVSLENCLRTEKARGEDKGQRSVVFIMARAGLTESEIFQASRDSRHVVRRIKSKQDEDDPGDAPGRKKLGDEILFEYQENGNHT